MDDRGVHELAVRLLTHVYPGMPQPHEVDLFVGTLPDELAGLPLPEGTRVLGGVSRGEPMGTEIVLDVAQSPEAILDFYSARMAALGWVGQGAPAPFGAYPHGGGTLLFCRGSHGPALHVQVVGRPEGPADVRLHLHGRSRQSPCSNRPSVAVADPWQLVPMLIPPPGARQLGGGGSGGSGEYHSTSTLESDLGVAELLAHYHPQLERAGWEMAEQGAEGLVGWSRWRLTDGEGEPWEGLLLLLRFADARLYRLHLYLQWLDEEEDEAPGPLFPG